MNGQGNMRLPPLRNLGPILPEPGKRSMESKAQLLARLEIMQREIFDLESQTDMGTAAEQRNHLEAHWVFER